MKTQDKWWKEAKDQVKRQRGLVGWDLAGNSADSRVVAGSATQQPQPPLSTDAMLPPFVTEKNIPPTPLNWRLWCMHQNPACLKIK